MILYPNNLSYQKCHDPIRPIENIKVFQEISFVVIINYAIIMIKYTMIITISKLSPERGRPIMELSSQHGFNVFFFILLLYFVSLFNLSSQNGSLKPFKSFATKSLARNNVTSIKPLPVDRRLDISEEAGSTSL